MKTFYKLCLAAVLSMLWLSNVMAQGNSMLHTQPSSPPYPTDTWYLINDGLAPCPATNGIPNGMYDVAAWGDIKPLAWSHRRGEVYALIASNNQSCIGWYKFDTVQHKWLRVADDIPAQYSQSKFYTTNGENIFQLFQGRVYQMVEANEYGTYPNGWKEISVAPFSPITESQVWPGGCRPNANDIFEAGARAGAPTAIGDTIFTPFLAISGCPTQNKIGKFSIVSGTWTFMTLSGMPWDLYPTGAGTLTFNENYLRAQLEFTFPIAGRFQIFMKIEQAYNFGMGNQDSTLAIPSFIWAYDYAEPDPTKKWKNISEGIDYNNSTPSANPYRALQVSKAERPRPDPDCINSFTKQPIGPTCKGTNNTTTMWEPPKIYISFDRKRLYATSGSKVNGGIYYWNGAGWVQQVSDAAEGIRPTNNGLFYKMSRYSDNQFYWMDGANNMQVGQINTFCNLDGLRPDDPADAAGFITPDDGKTWYLRYVSNTAGCVSPGNVGGFYRLVTNFVDKPSATRNLHLNTGTYLGNTGTNEPVGTGVGGGYRVIVGMNSNGGMPQSAAPYAVTNLPGANSLSPGKILVMNTRGDSIIRVINVGNSLDELEVQEVAPFRIAVTGDFGLKVLDSTGTSVIWQHNLSGIGLPSSGIRHVDISTSGQVAVARAGGNYQGKARVFAPNGTLYTGTIYPNKKTLLDVTIKNDTVAVVGEHDGKMQNWCFACGNFRDTIANGNTCPPSPSGPKQWPIRIPFIHFHAISSGNVNTPFYTKTYDFPENQLQPDAADAKITGANFGKDGKLYILGEHAGPNSVLRWNGKTNYGAWWLNTGQCGGPPSPLQQVDGYNSFSVTLNPIVHIGFVGKVNPATGEVENGTLMYSRQSNGAANSLRLRKINTDAKGYIYVGGTSSFRSKGRDLTNINGNLVGPYSGDATYAMLSPNFRTRMFWGPFNASNSTASGDITGIGIRDNIVSLVISGTQGKFHTTGNAILSNPFNPSDQALTDAYLAVFYQDLWNHANNDSVQDKAWPSDTLINPAVLAYKAEFDVTSRKVCVNTPITFLNQSVGDSILTWDFGNGASLLPGTQGAGPFSVSYSTLGYKTPRLDVLLKNGLTTYNVKHQYIEVLSNSLSLSGSITGPSSVCPGSEAVYSVPATNGVTFYNWSFPAGTQILYGAGGPSVRVVFGNSGGTVSVTGQYACGTTAALTKAVSLSVKNQNKVIIVGKEKSPNTVMTFDGDGDYFQAVQSPLPTVARDSSGNARNGTATGGVLLTRTGNSSRGGVALFTANTGYFSVAGGALFANVATQPYTIAGWIKPSAVTGSTRFIMSQKSNTGTSATDNDFSLVINSSGQLAAHIGRNGGNVGNLICAGGSITAGAWNHVAFVKEGNGANQVKLYINGTEVAQGTHNLGMKNTVTTMIGNGANGGTPNNSMVGEMDALAVWNVALTSTQIANLAATNTVLHKNQYQQQANIIAEWDFNEFNGFTGVHGPGVSTAVTVEFWLKTSATTLQTVVSWGGTASSEFDVLIDTDGLLRIERGTEWYKPNGVLNDGQWHHVAISIPTNASAGTDASRNPQVYIDGVLRTRNSGDATGGSHQNVDAGAPVRIGITSRNLSNAFLGEIDDLRIWDTNLNANEILSFFGTTDLLSHPKYGNLQYHVHNDMVGATIATDFSVNNYATFRQGNATWANDPAYQADLALKSKLEGKGFTVEIMKAGEISNDGNEANCAGLIYVSSTVVQAALGQKLRSLSVPVIVAQPGSYNAMAMVPSAPGNWGGIGTAQTQVNVTDISQFSVLGANLSSTGATTVYSSNGQVYWGRPLSTAISVAHNNSNSLNKTLFGYETNALMVGGYAAPARRVGLFLNTYDLSKLQPQYGDSLFNRAICWALNNCPSSNEINTGTVSPAVYCPGDSITVPFTTTGSFLLTNLVSNLPNNQIEIDAGDAGAAGVTSHGATQATGDGSINGTYLFYNQGHAPASSPANVAWTVNIPYSGVYHIQYFVPNRPVTLNTNAALRIERPDTSNRTVNFNMNTNKGNWVTVASSPFKKGNATVRMLNTGTSGSVIVADAVRFVLQSVNNLEGNDFLLQFSDNNGHFTAATVIGKLENNNSATSIKGVLPTFLPQGNNYKVRVVSTVPPVTGTPTPTSITISASQPEPTAPIIGNSIACAGATVQGFKVVDPPSNASGYQWDIPLGSSFIGPNDRDTVTIQFNTATTNDIAVRKVGNCGLSSERTLRITLAGGPPAQPGPISGRTVVCTSLTSVVYTIAPVTGASFYKWNVPTGAVVVGNVTGNSITVNYTNATQGAGQITVRASNDCGDSDPRVLNVVIDNAATLPVAGTISGAGSLCPNTPNILYTVTPVAGATNYIWTVSGVGASIDTVTPPFKNQMRLTVGSGNATISVSVVDACGVSAPSTRVITVGPSPLKRALVITDGDIVTPNAGDAKLKDMLEAEGYTVNFKSNGSVLVADDYCYTVGVVSPSAVDNCNDPGSGGDVTKTRAYRALPIPMIVMNPRTYDVFGIGTSNCATTTGVTNINIVNASHPLANGLSGSQTILSSAQNYVWANTNLGTVVANTGTANQNLIWAIDTGTVVPANTVSDGVATHNLPAYTTKARIAGWVGLGHHDRSGTNPIANYTNHLNATGEALFKRAVCWVTNSCDPISITLNSINATTFCAGQPISALFNVTGTIGAGNVFQLQLSDASGSFASPTVVGTLTSNTPGTKTITANLPLSLPTGTGYKVRIRSTQAVSLSNQSTAITINAVPAQASAISGTSVVCPAQTGLVYSVTNVSGVTYNWTLPVGASIVSGQGTNSIVANMSGANSGSISVTTTQNGCTNTLAQTLPLTFTSGNSWTGSVSTAWENPSNWSCGFLPTATTDVTITNVVSNNYPVVSTSGAVCKNLTINGSNASVSILAGGTLTLHGNLTRTLGSYTHNSGGTLVMSGSAAQTINMNGAALTINGNLTISNPNGLTLASNTNTTINGTLSFTNGKLTIGTNNLTMGASSNIIGQSLTRYIVVPDNVSATNFVTRTIPAASSGVIFPIGNSGGYSPVVISNNGSAFTAQVRTFTGVYQNGNTGSLATEKAVNRSWQIIPSTFSANMNVKFQWNSIEHLPLFLSEFARVRTNVTPGSWDIHTAFTPASGAGVVEMTAHGLTGASKFPMFSIVSINSALPPFPSSPIMVVGSLSGGELNMTKADTFVYDSLVARGYTPTVVSDVEDAPSTVNSSSFVWIASSVSSSKLGTKYRDVACPVIINAPVLLNMGLTFLQNGTLGAANPTATLRNITHLLSKGKNNLTPTLALGQSFTAHAANKNFLTNNNQESFVYGMVYDSSGNNRNAVMAYATAILSNNAQGFWKTDDPAPGRNSAVEIIAAQGRYISVRGYNGPVGTSARSFSAWVKLSGTNGTIVSWGRNANTTAGQSITLRSNSTGRLRLDFGDGNTNHVEGTAATPQINDGNWHHVAFTMPANTTINSGDINLYVDGALIAVTSNGTASINLNQSPAPVRFGRNVTNAISGGQLQGLIDDVAIWDAVLTPSEVTAIYNATNGVAAQKSMYPKQANLQFETDFIKVRDAAIVPIMDRGGIGNIVFAAFEQGRDIFDRVAAGKRVTFPYSPSSYSDADGITGSAAAKASFTRIMNNTLCWVTNSCNTDVEIATNAIPTAAFCQGDTIDVSFTSTNTTFNSGNTFTVQLSDASGSFASPQPIGTLSATSVPFLPIKCVIPPATPAGLGYRVRVVSSNPAATTMVDNGSNIEIRNSLPAPATITGPSIVCVGQSGIIYTASTVSGATSYTWILPSGAIGSSSSNTLLANMGTATSGAVRVSASNGVCSSPTRDLVLTFNTTNTWSGGTSTAWSVASNWGCNSVPTRNSAVVIPSSAPNMPTVNISQAEAGSLTINNGGTLSFGAGNTLNLYGNLSVSGANAINTSNGTIAFRDTITQQTMTATDTVRFNNLTIANPNGVRLLQHARVRGVLNFVRGNLILDAHNLVFTSGGSITGQSPQRYIVTRNVPLFNGSFVIRPVGSSPVLFPVGTPSSFTPARLTNSGTVRPIKVRAFAGVYQWGTSGAALTSEIVDRTWEIEPIPSSGHGVNANITLRWNSAEERTNFFPTGAYVRRNVGGVGQNWQNLTSGGYTNLGGGVQEITANGVSNFSKFAVFSQLTPLPLSLLDFVGYNINDKGELYWRTANELNVSHFEVEKSVDGYKFEVIGNVAARGGSAINQYRLTDDKLVQDSYYRLRIVDFDGSVEYSHVVVIKAGKTRAGHFSLYPNPVHGNVTIGYDGALQTTDVLQVRMFTVHGVELLNSNGNIQSVNNELNRRLANVSQGMYLIHIHLNGQLHKFKLVKE